MAATFGALETLEVKDMMLRDGLAIVVIIVIRRPVLVVRSVHIVVHCGVGSGSHHKLVGGYRLVAG